MNRQYAIEILEIVERHMLNSDSCLAKEAFRYLDRLKKLDKEIKNRVLKIKYKPL